MEFKTSSKDGLTLFANDVNLEKRWTILNPRQMEERMNGKWSWFNNIQTRKYERTKLHLVYDENVRRPAIAKTVCYRPGDVSTEEGILKRRSILMEQINILNEIASPLLPEPLDWFTVTNTVDGLPENLRDSEPVLILDYQPGSELKHFIGRKHLRFRQTTDGVDTPKVGRVALAILYFLKILRDNEYAYLDLNPEHILLLKNYIPRFVGLGRICRTKGGRLDQSSVNFGMTSLGYSAPELNNPADNWRGAREATPEQVGAFSLGVLMHQMVYENTEFEDSMIKNGSFIYPNGVSEEKILKEKNGDLLNDLISRLCEHDPGKRLTDFDEIESVLKVVSGNMDRQTKPERQHGSKGRPLFVETGWVKWYDPQRGFGFIVGSDGHEYHISRTNLDKSGISMLYEDMWVKFDVASGDSGAYAINVEPLNELNSKNNGSRGTGSTHGTRNPHGSRGTRGPIGGSGHGRDNKKSGPLNDSSRNQSRQQPNSGCFVSTVAYGTSTAPRLDSLRWFRDEILGRNTLGKHLVSAYYKISPRISRRLDGMPLRKDIVRRIIDLSAISVENMQRTPDDTPSYWLWSISAIAAYLIAFTAASIFVLPEKLMEMWDAYSNRRNK